MKVVQIILLLILICVSPSHSNEVKDASLSGLNDFHMILKKLEYLHDKINAMESAMKEADQKLLSAINQQSVVLQTQWENDLESLEQKISIDINKLTQNSDQNYEKIIQKINMQSEKLVELHNQWTKGPCSFEKDISSDIKQLGRVEKMDLQINQQNDTVTAQLAQEKEDREFLDEELTTENGATNQLGQSMDPNLSSSLDEDKSVTNKSQTDVNGTFDGVSQPFNQTDQETEVVAPQQTKSVYLQSCKEELSKQSGKYLIQPPGYEVPFEGYCEHAAFDGGWIVFQYRFNGSVDFFRNWTEYRNGFGSLDGEFWLGLEHLYRLTSERRYELLVEVKDYNGTYKYAWYDRFEIDSESGQYALKNLGKYSGTAGDALKYHKGMKFSTKDMDNDRLSGESCALDEKGAWWYRACAYSNLNSLYTNSNEYDSIHWSTSYPYTSLAFSRMLMRET